MEGNLNLSLPQPLRWAHSMLRGLPARVKDRHFWFVQATIISIAAFHFLIELEHAPRWFERMQSVTVILYILPITYSSLRYGWEGGLLTSIWVGLLSVPNMVLWHAENSAWIGELMGIGIIAFMGTILAWRTEVEARLRIRVEAAMRELKVSEVRYQSLFENAGDAILVFDTDGRISSANTAATTLTGYSPGELVGMSATSLFHDQDAEQPETAILKPKPFLQSGELRLRQKGGGEVYVEAVCTALPEMTGKAHTQAVLRDISARRHRELGLRAFLRQVTRAQEDERKRIARELHDETAQNLALLRRGLQDAVQIEDRGSSSYVERLKQASDLAGETLRGVRRFTSNLRPPVLDDLGLVPALETLVSDTAKLTGADARLSVNGTPRRLDPEAELMLFRIVQESLRNTQKYAEASRIRVSLSFGEATLSIEVEDDGKGFDLSRISLDSPEEGHLGLAGMVERASLLGAEIKLDSSPGRGTRISVLHRTKEHSSAAEEKTRTEAV